MLQNSKTDLKFSIRHSWLNMKMQQSLAKNFVKLNVNILVLAVDIDSLFVLFEESHLPIHSDSLMIEIAHC